MQARQSPSFADALGHDRCQRSPQPGARDPVDPTRYSAASRSSPATIRVDRPPRGADAQAVQKALRRFGELELVEAVGRGVRQVPDIFPRLALSARLTAAMSQSRLGMTSVARRCIWLPSSSKNGVNWTSSAPA